MSWLQNAQVEITEINYSTFRALPTYTVSVFQKQQHRQRTTTQKQFFQTTYSEIHQLKKRLYSLTNHGRCCCLQDVCPFQKWHDFLNVFVIEKPQFYHRRDNMKQVQGFLKILFGKVHDTPSHLVLRSWENQCKVLHILDGFFAEVRNLKEPPPRVEQSLALSGWHQSIQKSSSFPINTNQKMENTRSNQLPELNITSSKVAFCGVLLEDLRARLLSSPAGSISELDISDDVSDEQLWNIAFCIACRIGNLHATRLLLSIPSVSPNSALVNGTTGLHIASRMGHECIVTFLLQQGSDVNLSNLTGMTPLIAACRNRHTTIVQLLLKANADVELCSQRGTYPLHAAVVSKSHEIVSLLLLNDADVNALTSDGTTSLHYAAKLGQLIICQSLVKHFADLSICTRNGSTAISLARNNHHPHLVEYFLKQH